MFVRLSGTGVHCDHTVHVSADLGLWLDSPLFHWAPWQQSISMSTYSQPSFSSSTWNRGGVWMCKLGIIFQERLNIKVKLLLSANRKSYMPRRLTQQRMTLSDLEWPFHSSPVPYVWEGRALKEWNANVNALCIIVHTKINVIRIARYLCSSWASCFTYDKFFRVCFFISNTYIFFYFVRFCCQYHCNRLLVSEMTYYLSSRT